MRAAPSILSAAIVTLLLGCSDGTGPSDSLPGTVQPPSSFGIAPSGATLQQGESRQLRANYSGVASLSEGTGSVTWFSTNEAVATVSKGGVVHGVGDGQAEIIAVLGLYRASALITVVGGMKKHEAPVVCLKRLPRRDRQLTSAC